MPITEHQRQQRRKYLGASDAPAILNLYPAAFNRGPSAVYWSKMVDALSEPTEAMQTGNRLEGPLVSFAAEQLGVSVRRNQFRVNSIFCANMDALIEGKREAIECKYVGPAAADKWGAPGTDEVPDYVVAQVLHQMFVVGLDRVWIAAAIARWTLEWVLYCVERNDDLADRMAAIEVRFWEEHIVPQIPPTDETPPLEILKGLRREPQSVVDLDATVLADWESLEAAKAEVEAVESAKKAAYARVVHALGDAEAGLLPDRRLITYLSQRGAPRFNMDLFRANHPKLYQEYATETSHRVLRIKTPKEAKT